MEGLSGCEAVAIFVVDPALREVRIAPSVWPGPAAASELSRRQKSPILTYLLVGPSFAPYVSYTASMSSYTVHAY